MASLPQMPDEELVQEARRALDGDLRAFGILVDRHQSAVITNCRYLTRSADDAEDLAQEVFVKAFFGLQQFEGRSSFKAWVQRIKVNHCLNFLRGKRKETHLDVDDEVVEKTPELTIEPAAERAAEGVFTRRRIQAVLDAMPETLRVPLLLRDMDGMSYQEIAEALGVGLSAVKMRIKRGREEFRVRYQNLEEDATAADA